MIRINLALMSKAELIYCFTVLPKQSYTLNVFAYRAELFFTQITAEKQDLSYLIAYVH